MIYIALGANLPDQFSRTPAQVVAAAMDIIDHLPGVAVQARSGLWETAPVPLSDQPWYVNAVVAVDTARPPGDLLAMLHGIEAAVGRVRAERWGPRVLDLDLIDYRGMICDPGADASLILPHPRMGGRAFVLYPLRELAPDWRHPVSGQPIDALIAGLEGEQSCRRLSSPV
jgi:2-amino-4-hydroxy-6-hydroxymethyldihydropteridine diphosphokinase